MTVFRLEPATAGVAGSMPETLDRMVSIIRKYATTRVAVRDGAVEASVDPTTLHCDEPEAARRLAVMAGSWSGTRVAAAPASPAPEEAATTQPAEAARWSTRVVSRGEAPELLRERVARAAARMAAMLAVHGSAPARWVLHLDRGGAEVHMPLPADAFAGDSGELARRLPGRALEGVTAVRLEARTGPVVVTGHQPAQPLSLVS